MKKIIILTERRILAITIATALVAAWTPLNAQTESHVANEVEPLVHLVVHSQVAGSNAIDMDASDPTGMANVDGYNFFFANGSGQTQSGTNENVRQQNISAPRGLGSQLLSSSESSAGQIQSRSQVSAALHKTDRMLSVIGHVFAESGGPGAMAFASVMLGVSVTGPSTIRVDNCELFDQGVMSGQTAFVREDGSCSFQASGNAADSVDPQGIPMPAAARDGQFIMFEIEIELGGITDSGGAVNGGFAIEILPGAGECALVLEGPGTSPVVDIAVTEMTNGIPNIIMYTRTDHDMALIQDEIDIGLSEFANEEAHAQAAEAAANLASPIDAHVRLEFLGPGVIEGVHTVSITPRNGESVTMKFDFDKLEGIEDLEDFVSRIVEVVRGMVEDC